VALAIPLVLVLVCGAAIAWWKSGRDHSTSTSLNQKAVAVLPFGNLGADKDVDFLRLALPDEIATTLSHVRSLSIRPFSETSKYVNPDTDLLKAGHEMRVSSIVTGHFLKTGGDQLQVTLEAIDVDTNQAVWRDTLNVAGQSMIAMREQVLTRIASGLVPALHPAESTSDSGSQPRSEEGYDLFLRSAAVPNDPSPNKEGIKMLDRDCHIRRGGSADGPNQGIRSATLKSRPRFSSTPDVLAQAVQSGKYDIILVDLQDTAIAEKQVTVAGVNTVVMPVV
jgi:TolB-like protein